MKRWKRQGTKVIMLPQAWGPFELSGWDSLRPALVEADLIYARDRQSLDFLQGRGVSARCAPDFTNLLSPDLPQAWREAAGSLLLIPNAKVVAGKNAAARNRYLRFLEAAAATLRELGDDTRILVHEGHEDQLIAAELNTRLGKPLPIMDPDDPMTTKALVGSARAVISSRFHGIISALSASVPTLACGWTHKYVGLMADYGVPNLVVDLNNDSNWSARLRDFADFVGSERIHFALTAAASAEKAKARAMWEEVAESVRTARTFRAA